MRDWSRRLSRSLSTKPSLLQRKKGLRSWLKRRQMHGKKKEIQAKLVGQAQPAGESMTQTANLILQSRLRTLPKVGMTTGHPLTSPRHQKTKRVVIRVHLQQVSITRILGKTIQTEMAKVTENHPPNSKTNLQDSQKVGALASKMHLTHQEKWYRRRMRAHLQIRKLRPNQMISWVRGRCSRLADPRRQSKIRHNLVRNLHQLLVKKPSQLASSRLLPPH